MKTHICKSWTYFFDVIASGQKTHDLRINDRDFAVGDFIILHRYDQVKGVYTGETCNVEITYITSNKTPCAFSSAVLDKEYCILSIKLIDDQKLSCVCGSGAVSLSKLMNTING